jgi:sugar-specific transcriptional regulator TrmB
MLRVLLSLGIRRLDAEVYLHLATKGPSKGRELSNELKMNRQQLYRSLKNLRKKGLVKASIEHPTLFTAVIIEDVLDSFIEAKLEEAQSIKEKKDELLSRWQSMINKNSSNSL